MSFRVYFGISPECYPVIVHSSIPSPFPLTPHLRTLLILTAYFDWVGSRESGCQNSIAPLMVTISFLWVYFPEPSRHRHCERGEIREGKTLIASRFLSVGQRREKKCATSIAAASDRYNPAHWQNLTGLVFVLVDDNWIHWMKTPLNRYDTDLRGEIPTETDCPGHCPFDQSGSTQTWYETNWQEQIFRGKGIGAVLFGHVCHGDGRLFGLIRFRIPYFQSDPV